MFTDALTEQSLRKWAHSIPHMTWVTDASGKLLFVNQQFSDYTGFVCEEIRSYGFQHLLQDKDVQSIRETWHQSLENGDDFQSEFKLRRKDGRFRWVMGLAKPIRDSKGQIQAWLGTLTDIHEQKMAEESSRFNEMQFRQLAEAIPHLVWKSNSQGELIYISQQWTERTGAECISALGHGWIHYVHSEDLPHAIRLWKAMRTKPQQFEYEFRLKTKEGEERWYLSRAVPILDDQKKVVGWFGTSTDIHEQKENREEQRLVAEATRILSTTFDDRSGLSELMRFVTDEFGDWGCLCILNKDRSVQFSQSYGRNADQGKIFGEWMQSLYSRNSNSFVGAIQSHDLILRNNLSENDYEMISREESQKDMLNQLALKEFMLAPLVSRGKLLGVWGVGAQKGGRKFTPSMKRAFKALSETVSTALNNSLLYENATKANELKSAFLANVSHEIRSPLSAILGFSDLLREETLIEQERKHYLEIIDRNGHQLQAVINDILDLSKVEAGQLVIEFIPVNIRELVQDVVSLLSVRAKSKKIELRSFVHSSVAKMIYVDPVRLKQILINLIGNAVKFTATGSVHIFVDACSRRGSAMDLSIRIQDTGIGICSEKVSALFQPFKQAEASTSRNYGGTGLGLALSKKLAAAMGGDIWLSRSELGGGSEFQILLKNIKIQPESKPLPSVETSPSGVQLEGLRVLIVDDSTDNQNLIRRLLQKKGVQSEVAGNGAEAVEKVFSSDFDLVLCDLQMPVMDGYTATRLMREKGFQKPIIALTAHAMNEMKQKCLEAGCTDHLAKPIRSADLYRIVSSSVTVGSLH